MIHLEEGYLSDEQNGFRKSRSCQHHIYALSTIIKNKCKFDEKTRKTGIFSAFVDFQKAFDYVDRDLLYWTLKNHQVDGRILELIKQMYMDTKNIVHVNNLFTDEFQSNTGVKQGDNISPTCYMQHTDGLIKALNQSQKGINVNGTMVCCLAYADDIVILAKNEADLQSQLDVLYEWCRNWRVTINVNKTKIVHFRRKAVCESKFVFQIGTQDLSTVNQYKYLGIVLDSCLDESVSSEALSKSGSRALSSLLHKTKDCVELGFESYTKLYNSRVMDCILDYACGAWYSGNSSSCSKLDKVDYRAMRYYCGLPRHNPILALTGDTGWQTWINQKRFGSTPNVQSISTDARRPADQQNLSL